MFQTSVHLGWWACPPWGRGRGGRGPCSAGGNSASASRPAGSSYSPPPWRSTCCTCCPYHAHHTCHTGLAIHSDADNAAANVSAAAAVTAAAAAADDDVSVAASVSLGQVRCFTFHHLPVFFVGIFVVRIACSTTAFHHRRGRGRLEEDGKRWRIVAVFEWL